MSPDFSTSAGASSETGPESAPGSAPETTPQTTSAATEDSRPDRVWRIADMSPPAVEAARAAARRAGMPLAVWLSGLIHAVADHEDAEDGPTAGQPKGQ